MDMDDFIAEAGWDEYAEDATQEVHRVQERDVESIQEENTQRIQAHEGDSCQLYRVLEVLSNVDYVFAVQEAPEALLLLLQHSDNRPFLQVVQLVVGWLHAVHHLPVRVCRLLLRVLWLQTLKQFCKSLYVKDINHSSRGQDYILKVVAWEILDALALSKGVAPMHILLNPA